MGRGLSRRAHSLFRKLCRIPARLFRRLCGCSFRMRSGQSLDPRVQNFPVLVPEEISGSQPVRASYSARAALRLGGVSPLGASRRWGPRAKESALLIRGFSLIPESDADSSRPQCFRFANFSRVFPKPALSSPASNELLRGHRLAAQEEPSERNHGVQTSGLIATDIALAGDAAVRSDVLSTVTRRRRVEVTTRLRRR